jgi:hypothetical protein
LAPDARRLPNPPRRRPPPSSHPHLPLPRAAEGCRSCRRFGSFGNFRQLR